MHKLAGAHPSCNFAVRVRNSRRLRINLVTVTVVLDQIKNTPKRTREIGATDASNRFRSRSENRMRKYAIPSRYRILPTSVCRVLGLDNVLYTIADRATTSKAIHGAQSIGKYALSLIAHIRRSLSKYMLWLVASTTTVVDAILAIAVRMKRAKVQQMKHGVRSQRFQRCRRTRKFEIATDIWPRYIEMSYQITQKVCDTCELAIPDNKCVWIMTLDGTKYRRSRKRTLGTDQRAAQMSSTSAENVRRWS